MKARNVRFVFSTSLSRTVSIGNALGAVIIATQCAISLPAPELTRRHCALYSPRYADAPLHYNVNEKPGESVLTTEIPETWLRSAPFAISAIFPWNTTGTCVADRKVERVKRRIFNIYRNKRSEKHVRSIVWAACLFSEKKKSEMEYNWNNLELETFGRWHT